jgi:hypothetical protein
MCTVLLPPGGYPTAVNKYINIKKRMQNLESVPEKVNAEAAIAI